MTTNDIAQLAAYRHLLTERQARVLELRLAGHSWRTIARGLHINEATVRGHHRAAIDLIARHKEHAP